MARKFISRFICVLLILLLPLFVKALSNTIYLKSHALETIKRSGEITIGVKTDIPPFGMLDGNGKPIGFEVDLAKKVAAALGVRLRTVGVTTENRFQLLEQGTIDLIIATAGDTKERRELATAIEPNYYGAGVNVLLRPDIPIETWQQLRGKSLCALQGAYFNKPITQQYAPNLRIYRSVRDAQLSLRDGGCIGFLYTDMAIQNFLKQTNFEGYKTTLASELVIPWAMSIARSEKGTEFEKELGDIVAQWHRNGDLISLEKVWGISPSKFLRDTQRLWLSRSPDGHYVCERERSGAWPDSCRNTSFSISKEMRNSFATYSNIPTFISSNITFVYDDYDRNQYIKGLAITFLLCFTSIMGAILIGSSSALLILSNNRLIRPLAKLFSNYGRMTPPLLQMYFIFFGVDSYLRLKFNISVPTIFAAIWCLSHYHGSMISSSIVETATALRDKNPSAGLNLSSWPQVIDSSMVGIRSALNNLCKATTIASAIAVPELLSATLAIINNQGRTVLMMNLLLLGCYLNNAFWAYVTFRMELLITSYKRNL